MTTKTYSKQATAKAVATKMSKTAPDGVRYVTQMITDGMFAVVEQRADAVKRRGPKPQPRLTVEDRMQVVRNHAKTMVEADEDPTEMWAQVSTFSDSELREALGRSKTAEGAIYAVEHYFGEY